ncbi:MAG: M3 family metallopeptidase [Rikenellaceae bacterium]
MKKTVLIMAISALMVGCGGDQSIPKAQYPELDLSNPLLAEWDTPHQTPPFSKISLDDYEAAFDAAIACSRAELEAIISNEAKPTFGNTIVALERQGELLGRVSGVFYPLMSANTSDEMQAIAMRIQPKLTELSNDISLNPELFARVKAVYENPGRGLSAEDKMLLENTYKGFARGGAALSDSDKELYREYSTELAAATLQFGQNSLAATNAFTINMTNPRDVADLSDAIKEAMALEAKTRGEKGWTVTLQYPSYLPFMTYSANREIKEKLWRANGSLALGGEFDNTENIRKIVDLRLKIANILGFGTYADYALDNRMADGADKVNEFLTELLEPTLERANADYEAVVEYAKSIGFEGEFMPWDFAYYSEKYKSDKFSVNDELIKPYLKLDSVVDGVLMLATKLYGVNFTKVDNIDTFDEEMMTYEVSDANGDFVSVLYLDFFPRASKRSGAWMTEFRGASIKDGEKVYPLITLTMNFTKPTETTPSLLTFDEFETFLHEFGHGLHGVLAEGNYESLNGTNVYRDFVELPSQLMENWSTEREYLDLWAVHYQTGEAIPQELIDKIVAAQDYNAAYSHVRQLQFGLLDMAWHSLKEPFEGDVESFERKATERTQILPTVDGIAMSPSFGHIFSGGYAAGYYSYKWAEVLEADAFAVFKEAGIFDAETAERFRSTLLSKGGQKHPMELYVDFAGHEPQPQALIDRVLK